MPRLLLAALFSRLGVHPNAGAVRRNRDAGVDGTQSASEIFNVTSSAAAYSLEPDGPFPAENHTIACAIAAFPPVPSTNARRFIECFSKAVGYFAEVFEKQQIRVHLTPAGSVDLGPIQASSGSDLPVP